VACLKFTGGGYLLVGGVVTLYDLSFNMGHLFLCVASDNFF
jgi:hypothetical protein